MDNYIDMNDNWQQVPKKIGVLLMRKRRCGAFPAEGAVRISPNVTLLPPNTKIVRDNRTEDADFEVLESNVGNRNNFG